MEKVEKSKELQGRKCRDRAISNLEENGGVRLHGTLPELLKLRRAFAYD